jgi:hypothetical protein
MLNMLNSKTLAIALVYSLLSACATEEDTTVSIDTTPATIPVDAVLITDSNALAIAAEANLLSRAINTASKADSGSCSTSGSVAINWLSTGNPSNGTISFNSCKVVDITTSGALGFSVNSGTAPNYDLSTYGALSIIDNGDDFRLFGISFTESGQDIAPSPYSYNRNMTFAVTLNSAIGGGVLFQTATALAGTSNACAHQGILLVSGANGSQLKISFISPAETEIELNEGVSNNGDEYTPITGSPFASNSNGLCF